jgi:hypothetical protein
VARPTKDPKPHVLSLRMGDADLSALDYLAGDLGTTRGEAALMLCARSSAARAPPPTTADADNARPRPDGRPRV